MNMFNKLGELDGNNYEEHSFSIHSAFSSILELMKCKFDAKLIPQLFNIIEPVLLRIINEKDYEL